MMMRWLAFIPILLWTSFTLASDRTTEVLFLSHQNVSLCIPPFDMQDGDEYRCGKESEPHIFQSECLTDFDTAYPCTSILTTVTGSPNLSREEFEAQVVDLYDTYGQKIRQFIYNEGKKVQLPEAMINQLVYEEFNEVYQGGRFNSNESDDISHVEPAESTLSSYPQLYAYTSSRYRTKVNRNIVLSSSHRYYGHAQRSGRYRFTSHLNAGNNNSRSANNEYSLRKGQYFNQRHRIVLTTIYRGTGDWITTASSRLSGAMIGHISDKGRVHVTP